MDVKRKRDADWSELEGDALEWILRKLSIIDVHHFKVVCTSWFSVAESYLSSSFYNPCLQTPWLMLPTRIPSSEDQGICFFNLDNKKEYKNVCASEKVYEGRCVGSSFGWLLFLDEKEYLHAMNPFSGARIRVASVKNCSGFNAKRFKYWPRIFIPKAVLISDPRQEKNNKNGVVVIYGSDKKKLAFCGYGDAKFIDLDGAHQDYKDITSYGSNMVCALSDQVNFEVWDFGGSFPAKIMDAKPAFASINMEPCLEKYYLVESCGELLLVVRFIKMFGNRDIYSDEMYTYKTLLFHVYRLDPDQKMWVEADSLGDQVLFVDENNLMSLKSRGCAGCRGNSIYFADCCLRQVGSLYWVHNLGVYSLKDGSVNPIYHMMKSCKIGQGAIWVVPNP